MADISTIRHDSIFDPHKHNPQITIIGVGATGSRVFAALVELGLTRITAIDFDTVEAHNLANQLYLARDVGSPKVISLAHWYEDKTGRPTPDTMRFINTRIPDPEHPIRGIVFLLTDTMASRREIFENCIKGNPDVYHVIETRMASTHGNVLQFNPVNPLECRWWESTLIDDGEAEVSPCGASISVGPTASIIANMAVWQLIHYLTNPEAGNRQIDLFLKPTCISTEG